LGAATIADMHLQSRRKWLFQTWTPALAEVAGLVTLIQALLSDRLAEER